MDGTILRPSCSDDGVDVLFCPGKLRAETKGGENEGAHLRLWRGSFWFASVLDDLFK